MQCTTIRIKKRKLCAGDLRHRIELSNRKLVAPLFNSVDFQENFKPNTTVSAAIETVTGKVYFDGASIENPITHIIYIRFDPTVTASTWIIFDERRLDILKVEDLDERKEFLKLTCLDRGLVSREASKA